jgi:hypothetical protein
MDDLNLRTTDVWTPMRGIVRGSLAGMLAALVLATGAGLLTWYAPRVAVWEWVRVGAAFVTMYILFAVVHRAAGMTGWACSAIVVVLTLAVAFSQHGVFAARGVMIHEGMVVGLQWASLSGLLASDFWLYVGLILGVLLWHNGAEASYLPRYLQRRVFPGC